MNTYLCICIILLLFSSTSAEVKLKDEYFFDNFSVNEPIEHFEADKSALVSVRSTISYSESIHDNVEECSQPYDNQLMPLRRGLHSIDR